MRLNSVLLTISNFFLQVLFSRWKFYFKIIKKNHIFILPVNIYIICWFPLHAGYIADNIRKSSKTLFSLDVVSILTSLTTLEFMPLCPTEIIINSIVILSILLCIQSIGSQ